MTAQRESSKPDLAVLRRQLADIKDRGPSSVVAGTLERLLQRSERERPAVAALLLERAARRLIPLGQQSEPSGAPNPWVGRDAARAALKELIHCLEPRQIERSRSARHRLDAALRAQEEDVFGTRLASNLDEGGRGDDWVQLASARLFSELQSESNMDQFVADARGQLPDSPGPLNPETLVIRALMALCQTAPSYLERLLGQANTLDWLAGVPEQLDSPARATAGVGKKRRKEKKGG